MTRPVRVTGSNSNNKSDSKGTGEFIMPRGKVKWFNNAKGYGFIIEDGCSDDLFAHFSSVQMDGYKTLKAGQAVTFEKKPSDKGVHAVNIVPDETQAKQPSEIGGKQSEPSSRDQSSGRDGYPPRAVNA